MTHAGAIAARLQHAHQQRTRREDEDMAGRTRKTADPDRSAESVWSPEKREVVDRLAERVYDELMKLVPPNGKQASDDPPQASAVSAERVVELERQLAAQTKQATIAKDQVDEAWTRQSELEQQVAELERQRDQAQNDAKAAGARIEELEPFLAVSPCPNPSEHEALATAYVAREVPWSDVAAGMMTISKTDGTPWMVERWLGGAQAGSVVLRQGGIDFQKDPKPGETVRVLVPYVTPEAAEELVATELGGVEA